MKTEEQNELQTLDKDRLAYMVTWRDRYIAKLEERLAGREEENSMLKALLFYALVQAGGETETGERQIPVSKQAVADALGRWQCAATDAGEAYLVTFTLAVPTEAGETRGHEEEKE